MMTRRLSVTVPGVVSARVDGHQRQAAVTLCRLQSSVTNDIGNLISETVCPINNVGLFHPKMGKKGEDKFFFKQKMNKIGTFREKRLFILLSFALTLVCF